ncbi:MAG TPA: hypothetical protein EYH44_02455 [Thermoprotei archaeon]|nr:hypothetical protein [Thermoprotei archaeon]
MYRAYKLVGGGYSVVSPVGSDFDIWTNYQGDYTRFLEVFYGYDTIRFTNIYVADRRLQKISGGGYQLTIANTIDFLERLVPKHVIVSPVYNEVPFSLVHKLSNLFNLSIDIQGFIRVAMDDGSITYRKLPQNFLKMPFYLFKLSNDEYPYVDIDSIDARYIVITDGIEGSTLIFEDSGYYIPSYPVSNVDETGSGDIYTYLFLYGIGKYGDAVEASCYASAYTSYILEGGGIPPDERFKIVRDCVKQIK